MLDTVESPETAAQVERLVRLPGVCSEISCGSIGWAIRVITSVSGSSVTLNDGISFSSGCFRGASVGDVWAVRHEGGSACFGKVETAILLQPFGRE